MGKLLSPGRREERQTIWISRAARSPGRVLPVDRYAVGVVSTATSRCACQGVTHSAGTSSFRFPGGRRCGSETPTDRKSTRLNSSHVAISYAVFCLKKKKQRQKARMKDT